MLEANHGQNSERGVPVRSLYLLDSDYETSAELDAWLEIARRYVPGHH